MRDELDVIDLDALVKPVGRVKLFGETHDVLPANGRAADLLEQLSTAAKNGNGNAGFSYMGVAREIVADSVPTLSEEHRTKLSQDQLTAIVGISTRQIDAVREMIRETEKNGSAPVVEVKGTAGAKPSTAPRSKGR